MKAWVAATSFFGVGRISDCEERIDAGMEHPSSEVLQKTIEKGEYSIWVSEADTKEADYLSLTLSLNNSMNTDHFHFSPGLGESSTRE